MLRSFCLFVLLTSLAGAGTPSTEPATGTIGADCDGITLSLDDMPNGQRATFVYFGAGSYPERRRWKPHLHEEIYFIGKIYTTAEQEVREPGHHVAVTFDKFNAEEASGSYNMTGTGETEQTGRFLVKHLKAAKHYICE